MPNEIHVCIDRHLPTERLVEAAERAVEESPSNAPIVRPGFGVAPPTPIELAAITGKLWENGRTLKVRFLDGIAVVQRKVEQYAHQWSQFANVKLDFSGGPAADIRISFRERGSWSYIGTDALLIDPARATMNFGWLTPNSDEMEYSRVVVHEFGHALGCIHEHQNPAGNIPWDKEAVYRYYAGPPNNWSREETDANLFQKYDRTITQFSDFDPQSIMLYPIPNEHTIGDFEVGWNRQLSAMDKQFIGALYPLDQKPVNALTVDGRSVEESIGAHGEEDVFHFKIDTEGRYKIETDGPTDVVMSLHPAADPAQTLAADDDSGKGFNAKIIQVLPPGSYEVRIRHYRPQGTGNYRVSLQKMS